MSRKRKGPTTEELEARADELLRQADREALQAILENTQAICDGLAQLKLPSNDPEYLKRLQTSDARRSAIVNKLTQIDIVADGNKSWVGVGGFPHGEARELAQKLAEHFEVTTIRTHE